MAHDEEEEEEVGDIFAEEEVGELIPMIYQELRDLARRISRRSGHRSMHVTSLVHEAYERLAGNPELVVRDRSHLLALTARAMRFILKDRVRRKFAQKRGGHWNRVDVDVGEQPKTIDVIALEEAFTGLEQLDKRAANIAQLRLLGGLTIAEIADVTGMSRRTVEREWAAARAWLADRLG